MIKVIPLSNTLNGYLVQGNGFHQTAYSILDALRTEHRINHPKKEITIFNKSRDIRDIIIDSIGHFD